MWIEQLSDPSYIALNIVTDLVSNANALGLGQEVDYISERSRASRSSWICFMWKISSPIVVSNSERCGDIYAGTTGASSFFILGLVGGGYSKTLRTIHVERRMTCRDIYVHSKDDHRLNICFRPPYLWE